MSEIETVRNLISVTESLKVRVEEALTQVNTELDGHKAKLLEVMKQLGGSAETSEPEIKETKTKTSKTKEKEPVEEQQEPEDNTTEPVDENVDNSEGEQSVEEEKPTKKSKDVKKKLDSKALEEKKELISKIKKHTTGGSGDLYFDPKIGKGVKDTKEARKLGTKFYAIEDGKVTYRLALRKDPASKKKFDEIIKTLGVEVGEPVEKKSSKKQKDESDEEKTEDMSDNEQTETKTSKSNKNTKTSKKVVEEEEQESDDGSESEEEPPTPPPKKAAKTAKPTKAAAPPAKKPATKKKSESDDEEASTETKTKGKKKATVDDDNQIGIKMSNGKTAFVSKHKSGEYIDENSFTFDFKKKVVTGVLGDDGKKGKLSAEDVKIAKEEGYVLADDAVAKTKGK